MLELTVFIIVKIPSLKATSKLKFEIVNKKVTVNKDNTKIRIDKKYLFMSV